MSKSLEFTNGDFVRSYTNQGYYFVEGKAKITQNVACILTTGVRATTGLGCGLDDLIGADSVSPISAYSQFPLIFDFQNRVRIGLTRLKSAQRQYHYAQRTQSELIYDFSPVEIWQDNVDPRNFRWKVDVLTEEQNASFSLNGAVRV
jgi:hypothetical protein